MDLAIVIVCLAIAFFMIATVIFRLTIEDRFGRSSLILTVMALLFALIPVYRDRLVPPQAAASLKVDSQVDAKLARLSDAQKKQAADNATTRQAVMEAVARSRSTQKQLESVDARLGRVGTRLNRALAGP